MLGIVNWDLSYAVGVCGFLLRFHYNVQWKSFVPHYAKATHDVFVNVYWVVA